ncbi:MAG: AAA family ATPase [Nanoarchaeota archaeon]|nr:AAA family ATPase [Nanoarchaeota archaeon]MCA9495953.1 AAA family ATPase [Nanoarchaeota archaeon]
MIILISGSVGSGKTSVSNLVAEKLDNCKLVHLNDLAAEYKIEEVEKLQTFDFDLDKLLVNIEKEIKKWSEEGKTVVLEGHFAHFFKSDLVDLLFVINRDLRELKKEYVKRHYNEQKIKDNLEVESFNLCFYEAEEEGYDTSQIFCLNNDGDLEDLRDKIIRKIENFKE